ncbi:MAG TPA: hypothetical protein ENK43_12255 [Planctomycetes bacterium]|nr:hypothetical protein [Planctomycetota bacterium]
MQFMGLPHPTALVVLIAATLFLLPAAAPAQEGAKESEGTTQDVKLTPKDFKKFSKLLKKLMEKGDYDSRAALTDAIEEFKKAHTPPGAEPDDDSGNPLKDVEAWSKLAEDYFTSTLEKRVSGKGRIQTETISYSSRGDVYLFEYAYRLPKGYTPKKKWPVILCIPDRNSTGKEYLKAIWETNKPTKALADKFILVAPTVGEKTLKGRVGRKDAAQARLDWFTGFHARAMLFPVQKIQGRFRCDPQRIYLEGVGKGADAAVQLACLYGEVFAAVAVRQGYPHEPALAPGVKGVPIKFLLREGSAFTKGGRKSALDTFQKLAKEAGVADEDLQIQFYPKLAKITPKLRAKQDTEPILEATPDVVAFLEKHTLPAYPESVRITTNNRIFVKRAWARLTKFDIDEDNPIVDFEAKLNRDTNTVEVTAKNVFGFTLFLNDLMLDLDKPVHVTVNGKKASSGTVERELKLVTRSIKGQPFLFHRIFTAYDKVDFRDAEPEKPQGDGEEPKDK